MGGEREDLVEARVSKKGSAVAGKVRFHESGGKVHFHADDQGLKAAVPVAKWYTAWEELSRASGKRDFIDPEQSTILTVETTVDGNSYSAIINISSCTLSDAFKALHKFTV